jgi:ATP-binding cassette subfamily B multidrug efflux pump
MSAFKNVFAFIKKDKKDFLIALLTVIVETVFELLIPFVMARMIDNGVKEKDLQYIYVCGAIISVCALMSLVNGLLYSKFAAKAGAEFGEQVRNAQFEKIEKYSFANLDDFEPSSLVTRVINDSMTLQNMASSILRPIFRAPIMLLFGIILPLVINWKLALIFIVLTPVLAIVVFWILKVVSPKYITLQKNLDSLNEKVQETLIAIRAVKAFVRKPYECEKFDKANSEYRETVTDVFKIGNLNLPAFQFVMFLATVLFMWFGGNMIINDEMLPGALTGILSYVMQTFNSLMMISNVFNQLSKSLASIWRVNEVLEEKLDLVSGNGEEKVEKGQIEFDHVSFRYSAKAKEDVLSDISFKVEAGQTIGIIGPTGSAKSTLVQLIPRLYDTSAGKVLIDGKDVKDFSLFDLRESIAMVLQKNTLFEGTILDNLKWGNKNPSKEELDKALKISCVDEFIDSFPEGLNTQVGEGGNAVSGGQKQRICLARALLKNPKVLILDDATSAVDTATERKIREGLNSIHGMTKIVISQRLLSVMEADKILILKDGKIAEIGTHQTLLEHNPIYQDLYNSQLKGVMENA